MEDNARLSRPLAAGDTVILSSGSAATVRKPYPAGYDGEVEILLDGAEEKEWVSSLTPVDAEPPEVGPELGDATAAQNEMGNSRAPSREMKD